MNSAIIYRLQWDFIYLMADFIITKLRDILIKYFATKHPFHKTKSYISNSYYYIRKLQFSNNELRRISQEKTTLKL